MAAQLAELTTAIPQLTQVPLCGLPAYGAIAAAGCGPKLDCICGNDNFYFTLQGVLIEGNCTSVEAGETLLATRSICTEAAPWLKHDRGPEVVAAISIMQVLATIAVILRLMARRISNVKLGSDDWWIIFALVWAYGLTITQYISVHYGTGRHILLLDLEQVIAFTKASRLFSSKYPSFKNPRNPYPNDVSCFVAVTLIFPVSAAAIKISVLLFYVRIFTTPRFRFIAIIIGLVVIAWFIMFVLTQFFTCIPLAYNWDKTIPHGHCLDSKVLAYYGTSPPDIATNLAILILPIPYLWNLQMPKARKLAITGIFILGSFAAVGSIVRIPFLVQLEPSDVSYTVVNAGIWLNVECNIGILSASLPLLRPLFSKVFPSIRSKSFSSRNTRYGTGSKRLPDVEKHPRSSTLGSSQASDGIYQGGGKGPKSWYDQGVSTLATKNEENASDCSQEEMVPMGKISVRHDVDCESRYHEERTESAQAN